MNRQSPNNNRRVRWRELSRWKNSLHHGYKNFNGRNFQFTKFSFIDFVFTDRWSLSGRWPKSVRGESSSCRSSFSAERNANTKATEYVTFGFFLVYWFSSPSREVWTSLSVNEVQTHECLAAIIRESSDKQLVLRVLRALPFIHQPGRVVPKASDMSVADCFYHHT